MRSLSQMLAVTAFAAQFCPTCRGHFGEWDDSLSRPHNATEHALHVFYGRRRIERLAERPHPLARLVEASP